MAAGMPRNVIHRLPVFPLTFAAWCPPIQQSVFSSSAQLAISSFRLGATKPESAALARTAVPWSVRLLSLSMLRLLLF